MSWHTVQKVLVCSSHHLLMKTIPKVILMVNIIWWKALTTKTEINNNTYVTNKTFTYLNLLQYFNIFTIAYSGLIICFCDLFYKIKFESFANITALFVIIPCWLSWGKIFWFVLLTLCSPLLLPLQCIDFWHASVLHGHPEPGLCM